MFEKNKKYHLATSLSCCNGEEKITLPKGYAVLVTNVTPKYVEYMCDEKNVSGKMTIDKAEKTLVVGPETLNEGEIFIMYYKSDWRGYYVYGVDFDKMAKALLKKYNSFCDKSNQMTISKMANDKERNNSFCVYKMSMYEAFDDEYNNFNEDNYVGDYLNTKRKKPIKSWNNEYNKKYEKWC